MISKRFEKNMPQWQAFAAMPRRQQTRYLQGIKFSQVKDVEELFFNILKGNVKVDPGILEKMRRFKTSAKIVGQKRVSLKRKKKIIQTGNGAALVSLGLSILPTLLSLLPK